MNELEVMIEQNEVKIADLHKCIQEVRASVDTLHTEHTQLGNDVKELLSIFRTSKEAIRFLGWVTKGIKWVIGFGLAITAAVAAFKGWIK